MFDKVRGFLKGVVNRLLKSDDIQKSLGMKIELSTNMIDKINEWNNMYNGHAKWCKEYVKSLRAEYSVCREFADAVLPEIDTKITNDKLNLIYQKNIDNLNENLQAGLALGSFILKPLGSDKAEFVTADKFIPLRFGNDGKLSKVAFVSIKLISDKEIYRKFEIHELTKNGLSIYHKAFFSKDIENIGRPCSLKDVAEWSKLPEKPIVFPTDRMDFGYYRNPIHNSIDGSFVGVSIFESAINHFEKLDKQDARLDWEFESGERAIHVDEVAVKHGKNGSFSAPQLNKRLYKGLNLEDGNSDLYKEYSPEFREQSIIAGKEEIKRDIEFNVGLSYGDLSNVNQVEKSATEVKASKRRKYNRVKAIQTNLKYCLEDFAYGLAFYNGLTQSGYEFNCEFKDSILTDDETERNQDMKDVAMGSMNMWEYRMKWYGEDEATAKANVPQQADIME